MGNKRILLTNHYANGPFEIIKSELPEGFELVMPKSSTQKDIIEEIPEADYLLVSGRLKINKEILDYGKKLSMVQRTGVGLDSLDLEELKARNLPLYVNAGINSQSVAEHTVLLILSCLRNLINIHANTKNGIWKKQEQGIKTFELSKKTVGLIGMGNIGKRVAMMLKGFGAKVLYYNDVSLSGELESELGIKYVSMDELLSGADIVSLHCPLNNETRHLIDEAAIKKMKQGVIIVNTARGGLIDTDALVWALTMKKVSFAGLDVFEDEPLTNDTLRELDNVILTPHIGGVTYDSFRGMMHDAMRNISLFEQKRYDEIEEFLWKEV